MILYVHEEWRTLCCAVVYAKRSVAWSRLSARVIFALPTTNTFTQMFNFITTKKQNQRIELWTMNATQYNAMFVCPFFPVCTVNGWMLKPASYRSNRAAFSLHIVVGLAQHTRHCALQFTVFRFFFSIFCVFISSSTDSTALSANTRKQNWLK